MARDVFYLVSDNYQLIERMKSFCQAQGVTCEVYSPGEWEKRMGGQGQSALTTGQAPVQQGGATIIPFPGGNNHTNTGGDGKVKTINGLESIAIENAIFEFNGNLTEAAKALGIGRATLYRKVKQYNIDPSVARKKRAA